MTRSKLEPSKLNQVSIGGVFWRKRLETNRTVTLLVQLDQCKRTGRVDAFKLDWKPGDLNPPHEFWDSDVAKWIEASAYSLATHANATLEKQIDEAIDTIALGQQPDGYLNPHFTVVEPEKKWKNLKDGHELYCAGHLMEAAVAYFDATGKRKFLDIMARYADHINSRFGTQSGKVRGYCGHPEIELALMRLARATGNPQYGKLAAYFVNERGRRPSFFDEEMERNNRKATKDLTASDQAERHDYYQAHRPIVEQKNIDGHAVRALYLVAGSIDVAAAGGDRKLLAACKRLWRSAVERRMYITGAVGSRRAGEAFSVDYDLPNETAYAETCANIALMFVAHRLLQIEPRHEYADVIERALYNGILSGVSLSGDAFRYANPLTVHAEALGPSIRPHMSAKRQEWFGCACCPPNLARVLASLGQYVYSTSADTLFVHLYAEGEVKTVIAGVDVTLVQKTDYPWQPTVDFLVDVSTPTQFSIALRIPGWCEWAKLHVNGKPVQLSRITHEGYAIIARRWSKDDRISFLLPMPIQRIETHPASRNNAGKVAIQRGPIVYCLEQVDNGQHLHNLALPAGAKLSASFAPRLLGGVVVITGQGRRLPVDGWNGDLYRPANVKKDSPVKLTAVPYCVWGNRKVGEMVVWIRSDHKSGEQFDVACKL